MPYSNSDKDNSRWIEKEIVESKFRDERLGKRFKKLMEQLSERVGESIPFACQDWANTKAAYRFFSNEDVSEGDILEGHFQSTRERFAATDDKILILHDTTEFSYKRKRSDLIGMTTKMNCGKDFYGQNRVHTVCGLLMHSSLAVTTEGLPLGLTSIKFWTRKQFKGTNALKRKINPTRVPIQKKESIRWLENLQLSTLLLNEPQRCVHIGDRESDIYELFCAAEELKTYFLVRTCVDRLAGDGEHTISDEMNEAHVKGFHRIEVRDNKGMLSEAVLEIKCRRIRVLPPIAKQKQYPNLMLTVIYAQERGTPKGREKINWKLITNLPVKSRKDVIEKLNWYSCRWKIETFNKILKSGCKTEESKLRTAQRLVNLIAVFCILSWRIFWMTMVNRVTQQACPELALTETEICLLDHLVKSKITNRSQKNSLSEYLIKLAKLGGYLDRMSDPPPGIKVMWRGLSRLTDIELGFMLGVKFVGN